MKPASPPRPPAFLADHEPGEVEVFTFQTLGSVLPAPEDRTSARPPRAPPAATATPAAPAKASFRERAEQREQPPGQDEGASTSAAAAEAGALALARLGDSLREENARTLAASLERLNLQAQRLAEQARSDALEIGFAVARRVLESELSSSPTPLFELIRSAIRKLAESRTVTVRLSPGDLDRINAAGGTFGLGSLSVAEILLRPDDSLKTGDCIVEGELGSVDGRLDRRIEELWKVVAGQLTDEVQR